jgi:diacylglycerol O-acyltransferase / wax synthase
VPMSIRKPGEELTLGNRITTLIVPLPLGEADPAERLRRIHETTARLKDSEAARAASLVIEASGWVPPTMSRVLGSIGAAGSNLPVDRVIPQRLPWNLVISNVPGPQIPLYCAGARVDANYPVSVITDGMGLNMTVMSYCGHLDFGLVADRDQMPDLWKMIGWLQDSLEELRPGKRSRRGSQKKSANGRHASRSSAKR